MKTTIKISTVAIALFLAFAANAQQDYYDVNSGDYKGLRFWGGSNNYKIHMGNETEYKFGPVQDYSIKMNMNNDTEGDRGWTWGVNGLQPVAALSNWGEMKIKKSLTIGTDETVPYGMLEAYATLNQDALTMHQAGSYGDYSRLKYNELRIAVSAPSPGLPLSSMTPGVVSLHSNAATINLTNNKYNYAHIGYVIESSSNVFRIKSYETPSITFLKITKNSNGTGIVAVDGKLEAEEIQVKGVSADFVFADDYKLRSLEEVETYINANKHLPEIAPASETEQGIELGQFTEQLLQKVEELTLYMIQQEKNYKQLQSDNEALRELITNMNK